MNSKYIRIKKAARLAFVALLLIPMLSFSRACPYVSRSRDGRVFKLVNCFNMGISAIATVSDQFCFYASGMDILILNDNTVDYC